MSAAERKKDFARLRTQLMGEAFEEYGAMGIEIEVYYAGTVDVNTQGDLKTGKLNITLTTEPGRGFRPGSLVIVRTSNTLLAGGDYGRGATTHLKDGKTTVIFLGPNASSGTVVHEFQHAFGWQPRGWYGLKSALEHLLPDSTRMRGHWPKSYREHAAEYANAY